MPELEIDTGEPEVTGWILISKNELLYPGERVRLYYSIIGPTYLQAMQIAVIEDKIEADPRFTLIRTSLPTEGGTLHDIFFEILVDEPPPPVETGQIYQAGITGAIIAVAIAAGFSVVSIFTWLSFREIRRWKPEAEEIKEFKELVRETGWSAVRVAAVAIIGVIAIKVWK